MKSIFKICIVLLVLSGNVYSQSWLWVKPQNINTTNPLVGNTRLTVSGNLVTFLAEPGGSHLQFIDAIGNVLWSQFFTNLTIFDVCTDVSDNIYFAGTYTTNTTIGANNFVSQGGADALIGEFNSSGTLIKSKTFGTSSSEYAKSIALSNNQLYVTGSFIQSQMVNSVSLTGNGSTFNTYLLKFDMNFVAQTGIETVSQGCEGIEVGVDQGGSVYLLGNSSSALSLGSQTSYIYMDGQYLAKLNNNLSITWLKSINDFGKNGYYRPFIYFDVNGSVVLSRVVNDGPYVEGGNNLIVEKYTTNGNAMWLKEVNVNLGYFVDVDDEDNIWVAGRHHVGTNPSDFSIVKVSTLGILTQVILDTIIGQGVNGLALKANNDFYIVGGCHATSSLNGYTCSPQGSIQMARFGMLTSVNEHKVKGNLFAIYPNPSFGNFIINATSEIADCTLCIKNTLGQTVYATSLKEVKNNFTKEIDISSQPKGIYFIELQSGDSKSVEKIVFQ